MYRVGSALSLVFLVTSCASQDTPGAKILAEAQKEWSPTAAGVPARRKELTELHSQWTAQTGTVLSKKAFRYLVAKKPTPPAWLSITSWEDKTETQTIRFAVGVESFIRNTEFCFDTATDRAKAELAKSKSVDQTPNKQALTTVSRAFVTLAEPLDWHFEPGKGGCSILMALER
jgi:hypothetical protein